MNIWIGTTEAGERIWLTGRDLEAHVHGVGVSRLGKSKLIEWLARELVKHGQGFCLIDPHGELYAALLRWLAHVRPEREIILLNPSYAGRVVGFNPFCIDASADEAQLWTKVDRMVGATLRAWGQTDTNSAPRLDRWLRTLYYTILEQGLSIDAARFFLSYEHRAVREGIVRRIRSPQIRDEWANLLGAATKQGFVGRLESAGNRLQRFITHPTVRRTMGLKENTIDLQTIMDERTVLLVNLQPSDTLSRDAANVIGTLLLNEVWEVARRRRGSAEGRPCPFYLVIDEFQNFATLDVPEMLDEGAKNGLHLMLFHQRLSQLTSDLQGAVRNAHSRFIFGGLARGEVATLLEGGLPSVPLSSRSAVDDVSTTVLHAKQHFSLRRPGRQIAMVLAPHVRDFATPRELVDQYVEECVALYPTPEAVDAMLAQSPVPHPLEQTVPRSGTTELSASVTKVAPTLNTPERSKPSVADTSSPLQQPTVTPTSVQQETGQTEATASLPLVLGRGGAQHKYLQQLLKRWGEEKGYRATIEKPVLGGVGSVDIVLERSDISIACEISVTTTLDHEIGNVEKCLAAGFSHVVFISSEKKVLQKARKIFDEALGPVSAERVHLFAPEDFLFFLESLDLDHSTEEKSVLGYKVKVAYKPTTRDEQRARKEAIAQAITKAMKRMRDRD
jgi:hypothetical protein